MQIQEPKKNFKFLKISEHSKVILSIIPIQWQIINLGSICERITKGTTPTTNGDGYVEKGVLFIKVESIQDNGEIDLNKCAFISKETHTILNRSQLKENDILFTIAGTLGRIGRVLKQHVPSNTNQAIAIIRLKEKSYSSNFLEYFLNSKPIQKQISIEKTIMAQPNLSLNQVSNLKIIKPTIHEQQKIVSILSNVDNLIESYDKVIESTKKLSKGLMQQLLTKGIGHTNFKKVKWYFGKEIEFPSEWNIVKLNDVCIQITDGVHKTPNYQENGIPFLSVNNIENEKLDFSNCKYISKEAHRELIKRCYPEKGDILLSKVGTLGIADEIDFDREFSIFVQLALLKPNKTKINSTFLKNTLNFHRIRNRIQACAAGTTLQYIGIGSIGNLLILLPKLKEQQRISSILLEINSRINHIEQEKLNLEVIKKGLTQKLLTGSIKV